MTATHDTPEETPREPVGSVAEEAARLIEVLSARHGAGRDARNDEGAGRRSSDDGDPQTPPVMAAEAPPTDHARDEHACDCRSTCRMCPVCQGIDLVRLVSPTMIEQLAGLADMAARTLRDLADSAREGTRADARSADRASARPGAASGSAGDDAPSDDAPTDDPVLHPEDE